MSYDSGRREHEPGRPTMEYDNRPDDGRYYVRCADCGLRIDENEDVCPWCGATPSTIGNRGTPKPVPECRECHGSGYGERYSGRLDEEFAKCRYCNGTGKSGR